MGGRDSAEGGASVVRRHAVSDPKADATVGVVVVRVGDSGERRGVTARVQITRSVSGGKRG